MKLFEYWHLILRDEDKQKDDIILCVDKDHLDKARAIIKNIAQRYRSGDEEIEDAVWVAGGLIDYIYGQLDREWINYYVFTQDENNTIYY